MIAPSLYPDAEPLVRDLPDYAVIPYAANRATCAVPENRGPSMSVGSSADYVGGSLGLRQHVGGPCEVNAPETLAPLLQRNLQVVAYPAPDPIV